MFATASTRATLPAAQLLEQTQRWTTSTPPAIPSSTACPAADWGDSRVIADHLTNQAGGDRPLWTFGQEASGEITSVKVNLFLNDNPDQADHEVALQTGVYLRNQNRAPTALFTAAAAGVRHVLLNGSTSSDPEGDPLDYYWFVNGVEVGRGLIFDYAAPAGGTYEVRLDVRDPSGLLGRSGDGDGGAPMTRICTRLRDERGWGLVSSVLVVGILLSLSLPLMSLVDGQQLQSAHERKSESSFNLAEGALDASVFVLGKNWPAVAGGAYPSTCTNEATSAGCPTPAVLASAYTGGDYTDPGWSIQIRDDDGTEYYDPATVPSRPTWDANGNQRVWVRADAHAAEGERSVVALVRRIDTTIAFPRNAITSGWLEITPTAPKVYVDTQGNAAQPAGVAVRCTNPPPSPKCLDFRQGQVSPDTVTTGFAGRTAVMAETLDQLRERAQALGTYSSGCPSSPAGELVFVESGNCNYAGGGKCEQLRHTRHVRGGDRDRHVRRLIRLLRNGVRREPAAVRGHRRIDPGHRDGLRVDRRRR